MIPSIRAQLLACGALILASSVSNAQSAQSTSAQLSLLAGAISVRDTIQPGIGAEAQLRFNRVMASESGVLSVGLGGQFTHHVFANNQSFDIIGAFIEPRYAFVLSSERFFPYLAGRFAVLQQSSNVLRSSFGYAAGGGGGFGVALGRRVNLDLGAAALLQGFNTTTNPERTKQYTFKPILSFAAKIGLSLGL